MKQIVSMIRMAIRTIAIRIPAILQAVLPAVAITNIAARPIHIAVLAALARFSRLLEGDVMRTMYNLNVPHSQLFVDELTERIPYHTMYGKPYCLPALTIYSAAEYAALALACERVHGLYRKTLQFVQQHLPHSYLTDQLAIHPVLARIACLPVNWDGLTRMDWIIGTDGQLKCIENNTETPTGIPETAYLEAKLLHYAREFHPASAQMNDCLQTMFVTAVQYYRQRGLGGKLYMTSYDWHDEDRINTLYMLEQCQLAGIEAEFVPLEQLRIVPHEGLYSGDARIELLYRLYPLEYLVEDREQNSGRLVGLDLLELIEAGKLGLINPVQHIITQSKGFVATLWSLYERNDELVDYAGFRLFTPEECSWIERYMLPTYFTPEPFIQTGIPYVSKSYFGREGQGTELVEQPGMITVSDQKEVTATAQQAAPEHGALEQKAAEQQETEYKVPEHNASQHNASEYNTSERNASEHKTYEHNASEQNTSRHNASQYQTSEYTAQGDETSNALSYLSNPYSLGASHSSLLNGDAAAVDWESLSPAELEQLELAATAAYYAEQPKIYQQLQPMEQVCVETADGMYEGYLLTGAFVIGGRFAGLLPRIGSKVTDNLAYYCAAAVRPDAGTDHDTGKHTDAADT